MDRSVKTPEILKIINIAFYRFIRLEFEMLREHQSFLETTCKELGLKGTVLISHEGVNGTLAGSEAGIREFQQRLEKSSIGEGLVYKESISEFVPFQRLRIKIKKEIIPEGEPLDGLPKSNPESYTAPRISASELKNWLDERQDFTLLDTRNDYEVEYGTFKNASHLEMKNFREFREKLKTLDPSSKSKPLVMFCTGGIRCEKASVAALQMGYERVFQLDGGILKYFEEQGDAHYDGGCFVFDERVALNGDLTPIKKLEKMEE